MPSRKPKTFGATIRDRRTELDMSQQTLADILSVSQPAVARWEADQDFPKPPVLSPLAAALGIPLEELLEPLKVMTRQPARSTREEIGDINTRLDNLEGTLTEILKLLKRRQ